VIPRHHLPDDVLMTYASGVGTEAVDVLVSAHLVLCPACRSQANRMEAIGGAVLQDMPQADVGEEVIASILDSLDDGPPPMAHPPPDVSAPQTPLLPGDLVLPRPIRDLVVESGAGWKTRIPGRVREISLPLSQNGVPVRLVRAKGGFVVPRHSHAGIEMSLVLSGGFHDGEEGYERGDVQLGDEEDVHDITIDQGEDCVLFVVNDAPLVPVGFKSKLTRWILGSL